tara:strand:- start:218 stop:1516 length:1299 start_codon:yes stop_codon:yes gene_type:complete
MIKSDPEKFWRQAHNIKIDIKNGKSFFETGYEYRIPYLPSKILYIYGIIFDEKFYEYKNKIYVDELADLDDKKEKKIKINIDNKKFIFLLIQSFIYYISIFFLYSKIKKKFNEKYLFFLIGFLCFEPNIIMFHSSFWSESIFLSLLIFSLVLIIDKNLTIKKSIFLGIILGLLFLQRSVAIYYIFIVLIYFMTTLGLKDYKKITLIFVGYLIVLTFLGYHNFTRSSLFQIKPTQAMDGLYTYLIPNILAKKNNKSVGEIKDQLNFESNKWIKENNIDLRKETNRLEFYKYLEKKSFDIILNNFIETIKYTIKRTLHFLVFDPLRHVYYFYKYSLSEQDSFTKTDDHTKNIPLRIFYSLTIYLLAIIGFFVMLKKNKNNGLIFLLTLSIIYFISVSSWTGNNRYNVPNLIFMSFFIVEGFNYLFGKFFKKNDY